MAKGVKQSTQPINKGSKILVCESNLDKLVKADSQT